MTRVLVVEDHHAIAQGLRENLELEGFEVRVSGDGIDAIQVASSWTPDLVLLDLMLPARSGFDVLAAIRGRGADMPVMVVSARGSEAEKVRALRAGADDYVVKPFGLMEVLARVHALLRRGSSDRAGAGREERYRLGGVTVDVPTRSVRRGAEPVVLRPKEFDLLVALCRARGAVVSRADLLNRVWGYGPGVVTRTVDTHIAALRQRLEADADDPQLIVTVWKAGYRVSAAAASDSP
jgi:two-component system, OmpR family, alkaline phosphatase synthesis response regulator PhoP